MRDLEFLVDVNYVQKTNQLMFSYFDEVTQLLKHDIMPISSHQPYFLTDSKFIRSKYIKQREKVEKNDLLRGKVTLNKIYTDIPKQISKVSNLQSIKNRWENHIPYTERVMFDKKMIMGMPYTEDREAISQFDVPDEMLKALEEYSPEMISRYASLFQTRIPYLNFECMDIEIENEENTIPDVESAPRPITSVAFARSNRSAVVYVLKREGLREDQQMDRPNNTEVIEFDSEAELIKAVFLHIQEMPCSLLVTFNGESFDLPYLVNRSKYFKIPYSTIPIYVYTKKNGDMVVKIDNKLHFDLYLFHKQPAIKIYAYNNKYKFDSLNDISKALLGKKKYDIGDIATASQSVLVYYNWLDSMLLVDLIERDNRFALFLVFIFMRLGRRSFEETVRRYISATIQNIFFTYFTEHNILFPNEKDLHSVGKISTKSMIDGKLFKGAKVTATRGMFFDVTTLDFASLYPSIIKSKNISFETINCGHPECTSNTVFETTHHLCTKNKGIVCTIVGFFRDVRVNYYKVHKKDNPLFASIERTLKVIINASYGGLSSPKIVALFCPPLGECVTAIGREAYENLEKMAEKYGIRVVGGDTDSAFLQTTDRDKLDRLVKEFGELYGLELDYTEDDMNVWMAIYKKKNRIEKSITALSKDDLVIKGLVGKKKHTPPIIKETFNNILEALYNINDKEDSQRFQDKIATQIVYDGYDNIINNKDVSQFKFRVVLGKNPEDYANQNEYVKVAKQLSNAKKGTIIEYVKGKNNRPYDVNNVKSLNREKYIELLNNTLGQILLIFGLNIDKLYKNYRQHQFMSYFQKG